MDNREELAALEQEIQRLREELASLDELPRERRLGTVSDLKGTGDITTSISKGVRSIPGGQDRYYLDLYLLQKERDRLAKETSWTKRRRLRAGRRLADISRQMGEKEEKAIQGMAILTAEAAAEQGRRPETVPRNKRPKQKKYEYKEAEWKRMPVDY